MHKIMKWVRVSSEQWYKKVSHTIFFWISMIFTVVLFMSFTDDAIMKYIWALFGVALELLKKLFNKRS